MNIKEQIVAKIETLNTLLRFLEELEKENPNSDSIEKMRKYILSMKQSYKEAYGIVNR